MTEKLIETEKFADEELENVAGGKVPEIDNFYWHGKMFFGIEEPIEEPTGLNGGRA